MLTAEQMKPNGIAQDTMLSEERGNLSRFEACPLCESGSFIGKYHLDKIDVYQCRDCRLLFLNPYTSPEKMIELYSSQQSMVEHKERLASYYENLEGSETEKFFDESLDRLKRLSGEKEPRLLDVACGNGYFLSRAKLKGWKVTGVDSSGECIRTASDKYQVKGYASSFETFQPDEQFDCITLWDFIEHVPNPAEIIEKARQSLKPGGHLLVATPNHNSLINFIAAVFYRLSFGVIRQPLQNLFVEEHILNYSDKTLTRQLLNGGFEIVRLMKNGTDIDRYATSPVYNFTAKVLLFLSKCFNWENRVTVIARKPLCVTK